MNLYCFSIIISTFAAAVANYFPFPFGGNDNFSPVGNYDFFNGPNLYEPTFNGPTFPLVNNMMNSNPPLSFASNVFSPVQNSVQSIIRTKLCPLYRILCPMNVQQQSSNDFVPFYTKRVQSNTSYKRFEVQNVRKNYEEQRVKNEENSIWFEPSVYTEETAKVFMEVLNEETRKKQNEVTMYSWRLATNLTDYNEEKMLEKSTEMAAYSNETLRVVNKFPWKSFIDPDLRRQFKAYATGGAEVLSKSDYETFSRSINKMVDIFSRSTVCEYRNPRNCSLALHPDLVSIFEKSSDPEELKYYWVSWRNASGKKSKKLFKNMLKYLNKSAQLNYYANVKDHLLSTYESTDFEAEVQQLWNDVKPFYEELHAYVRRMLLYEYGRNVMGTSGTIPAHILGDMWAQEWSNIFDKTRPYDYKISTNEINKILDKDFHTLGMFKLAEQFYQSINFTKLPDKFYKYSVLEKPEDRTIVCHANAWNFFDRDDFRIKMCTRPTLTDLLTIHHEMGHVYYYILYQKQPFVFRNGANPGFHEAVGDSISLSINPLHLYNIGLIKKKIDVTDYKFEINFLYAKALNKIPLLPWAYIMDLWRWKIYTGEIKPENYNCEWWKLRYAYQGVSPPIERTEDDFDPAAKFHIAANVPYIRYFVAVALQYQFHEAMCKTAGLYDPDDPKKNPLHLCSIYKQPAAGRELGKMLEMGASKPWRDILESFTGQRTINAGALLRYFAPLYEWLKNENRRHKNVAGWNREDPKIGCVSKRKQSFGR